MSLEVLVYDSSYTHLLGSGPIIPQSVRIQNGLDNVGTGAVVFLSSDVDAVELVQPRRILECWHYPPDTTKRKIGAIVVHEVVIENTASGRTFTANGNGLVQLLLDNITLPNLVFDNVTVTTAMTVLAALAGWTVVGDATANTKYVSLRLDGQTIWRAMRAIADIHRLHIRTTTTANQISVGAFGSDNGYVVSNRYALRGYGVTDPTLLTALSVTIKTDATELCNSVLPTGGGDGDAALTLEKSTRSGITTVTANGRSHYLIEDATSISTYGRIRKRINLNEINPVGNTANQVRDAANALYDAAKAWLDIYKNPVDRYSVVVEGHKVPLICADKIRFSCLLTQDGGKTEADVIHDIDDLFWITNTDEYFSADGWRVILDIADQSAIERDDVQILVGAIDAVTVGEVTAQPTFNGYQWGPYQEPINSSNDVTFQMRIDEYTLEVVSVKLSLRTRPFVTTTLPRSHRHRMFLDGGTVINDATERRFLAADSSTGFINLHMFINNAFLGDDVYTYDAEAGAEYGVYRDTLYPSTVTLKVNGVTIASGLDSGGVGINDVYDITSAVLGKVGGYRNTDHSIEVECTGGRGMIEATALVYRHISQIRI